MRAILVLYMTKALSYDQKTASIVYGLYTALVYLTPLAGGLLADRVLGYRRSIMLGGLVMAAGQFCLSVGTTAFFVTGLGLLVVGNGFFKPNISTLVGTLYQQGDSRRDRGFTIFYMGINLGAFFSPIVCGTLGEDPRFGYAWGFRAAGVGMLVGLAIFALGQRALGDSGLPPTTARRSEASAANATSAPLSPEERRRVWAIVLVALLMVFFWMAFEQAGNTLTTWADERTDRMIFGWEMKASHFQSINPLFIIALAPIVSQLWKALGARGREPSTPAKMVLGLTLVGVGFVPMVFAAVQAEHAGKAAAAWLFATYFLHTVGELCLSPVGLSFVTKLAPKKYAAILMGTWFLPVFLGNLLAGVTGSWYTGVSKAVFFAVFVASSLAAAAILLAMSGFIKGLMGSTR
jgi:POT family proton-dependent oligopeptide transporter